MVVGEEVKLVEEVANVDAAKRIHLGERKNAGKSNWIRNCGR